MVGARQRKGQATVELALGLLVFVTVLVFGIHFAEVGFLSLKVQEASASAIWSATAAKMHVLPGDFSQVQNLVSGNVPGSQAQVDYMDFDGRSSQKGGAPVRLVFTRAQNLEVTCEPAEVRFAPAGTTEAVYTDVGGMRCRSQASMSVYQFPESFLDSGAGALFKERHYNPFEMTICGVNRGGGCQAGFAILLDDWGLATQRELNECEVLDGANCDNPNYYQSAQLVYQNHLPGLWAAEALAQQTVGGIPSGFNPSQFYMSFRVFQEQENGGDSDPNDWLTTPGAGSPTPEYDASYNARGNCFLGLGC